MIHGVGTDIVAVERLRMLYARHGERAVARILAPSEADEFAAQARQPGFDAGRFLAKRFAAKEAFGKAMGSGIRAPLLLGAIGVAHDELGKPFLVFSPAVASLMSGRRLRAHLSLSDEREHALAFVVVEVTS